MNLLIRSSSISEINSKPLESILEPQLDTKKATQKYTLKIDLILNCIVLKLLEIPGIAIHLLKKNG
jgi:hypothetical protein